MRESQQHKSLEEGFEMLLKQPSDSSLTVGELIKILSGKGIPIAILFLSLPFCQPLQIPGLSTPFGIVIVLLGMRMALGSRPWLPKKIKNLQISAQTLHKIAKSALWLIHKLHRFVFPRMTFLSRHPALKILNGLTLVALGLYLALPLPIPFSNLVAAWPAFLIALGIAKDDGLLIVLGYTLVLVALLFLFILIFKVDWSSLFTSLKSYF